MSSKPLGVPKGFFIDFELLLCVNVVGIQVGDLREETMASFLKWSDINAAVDITGRSAENHRHNDDLFEIVGGSGEMEFTVGGKADGPLSEGTNPLDPTVLSPGIIGGEEHILKRGMDPFHIPRGEWHQWSTRGIVYYRVLKIPVVR